MTKWIITLLIIVLAVLGIWYLRKESTPSGETPENEEVTETTPEESGLEVVDEELVNTDWVWVRTETAEGEDFVAPEGEFVLRFSEDGTVTSTTDCNSLSGQYVNDGEVLSFGTFTSTLMLCEDSVETEYQEFLSYTNSYVIDENELRLSLASDVGEMVFVAEN